MKKLLYSLIILAASVALVVSCADESLDPLPTKTVLKGTILALRGDQLDKIYFDGDLYGASFFGNNVTGTETFDFDTEFLSSDPSSLASFDIYLIRKDWDAAAKKYTSSRVLLTNIPASQFKTTDDYPNPWVSVSLKLTDMLVKLGLDPINKPEEGDTLLKRYEFGIAIESDINLTDGTKVLASQIQAAGLFQSNQFYPAQKLSYGVTDVNDSRPSPTITQRGQFSVSSAGKAVHTIVPLKDGAKDTIDIKFDQAIDVAPTLAVSPAGAGTLGTLVKVDKSESDFYVVYTATGTSYTGNVTLTVSGATSAEEGALNGLEMEDATKAIAVDNLAPQLVDFTTGTRVGKGGSVVITAKFNEKLGKAPKVTIDVTNTKVDAVTAKSMTLSADGLSATYNYDYKDTDGDAVHGAMAVTIDGGSDAAGNAFGSASKNLVIDIGVPPAPLMVANNSQFDWGTQIKWTITQSTDGNNPGGSTTGTVYFVAIAAGSAPPTGFVAGDAPAFTMAAGVKAKQNGSVAVTSGTTGSVFTAFTANGSLDIYAVFVGSTGNISAISTTTPVVQDLDPLTGDVNGNNVPGNPINVTMN